MMPPWPLSRRVGLVAAPALALLLMLLPPPSGLSQSGWYMFAIAIWMAVWWMTEAIPLAVTALLPVVMFPVLNVSSFKQATENYADPLIFLFLGGFILARAISICGLDRRLASRVIGIAGDRPTAIIAAVMAVSAFLSMWVSNTATAMVMLPIALSISSVVSGGNEKTNQDFAPALLLGVAYAATIGGIGTIIGTPPNALLVAFLDNRLDKQISFVEWMMVGLPIVLILLPLTWMILTRAAFTIPTKLQAGTIEQIKQRLQHNARMSREEKSVLVILLVVVTLWLTRPLWDGVFPNFMISDAAIAITGAILLFVIPADMHSGRFLLEWKDVASIRWDVLILFGGGLALASGISQTDLASWTGTLFERLADAPQLLFLLSLGVVVVLIGELASNTALAAILLPVVAAIAVKSGIAPELLMWPVALFATLGFMLPVATPPNAIIFGSHAIELRHMIRAGVIIDIVGILVVTGFIVLLGDILVTIGSSGTSETIPTMGS